MKVLLGKDDGRVGGEITFLYELQHGLELTSHAAQCELLCGIPRPIVERAAHVASLSRSHNLAEVQLRLHDTLHGRKVGRGDADLQRAEEVARAFVQWDLHSVRNDPASASDLHIGLRAILAHGETSRHRGQVRRMANTQARNGERARGHVRSEEESA